MRVIVRTIPEGGSITVDGVLDSTTQTFTWLSGSSHTISTSSTQLGVYGAEWEWTGWSDGGAISHTVTPTSDTVFSARFNLVGDTEWGRRQRVLASDGVELNLFGWSVSVS